MDARTAIMYVFRGIYLALILYCAFINEWSAVLFNGILFVVTLILPYLGKKRSDYLILDAIAMAILIGALLVSLFFTWDKPTAYVGIDKLFHLAGGFWLGWFACTFYRDHIVNRWVFLLTVVIAVLGIGAAWEGFEWVVSILPGQLSSPFDPFGLADTMADLAADTIGGIVAALLYRRP